ncbi:MAG: FAD-dependent monooxygenase [Pseudomonadota bacterium]
MKIAIAGGGIGGLTLAGLLDKRRHEVVVVEQAAAFGEVGAGVLISANGVRVLSQLGLDQPMKRCGTLSDRMLIRRWQNDAELMEVPMGAEPEKRWGFPNYTFYRPDIIDMLSQCLTGAELRLDARVAAVEHSSDGASLQLESGGSIEADIVIGADGTHSQVRESVYGAHPSRYSGYVGYRVLIPSERLEGLSVDTNNRIGPDGHVVSYFIGENQAFFNVVFITLESEWAEESWTALGSLSALRDAFEGWSEPLQLILSQVEDPVYRWALHDREPLSTWQLGRVTLLGDAAHPVLPFMAQGASQAIEDAAVLSRCLNRINEPLAAIARYEAIRKPRTDRIQHRSRINFFHKWKK